MNPDLAPLRSMKALAGDFSVGNMETWMADTKCAPVEAS